MVLEFCLEKELCLSNTWFKRGEKRKVTFRMSENETKIYFVLIEKEHIWFIPNVKAVNWEFQNAFVIADIDKIKIRKVAREKFAKRR